MLFLLNSGAHWKTGTVARIRSKGDKTSLSTKQTDRKTEALIYNLSASQPRSWTFISLKATFSGKP